MRGLFLSCLLLASIATFASCHRFRASDETHFKMPRVADAADVVVPPGYKVEVVAEGLTFPTGIAFDNLGLPYVTEAGYSSGVWTTPRLLRLDPDNEQTVIAQGDQNGPWNGVDFFGGHFYVAEGGLLEGGRILKIAPTGETTALVENLPSHGDHHTNGPVAGPDGFVYFGQGTATNSGVVGPDNYDSGWLQRFQDFHDIPAQDITLAGVDFESDNPFRKGEDVVTGAYLPFGTPSEPGQVIKGEVPCTGAILRVPMEGGDVEMVAWGLRNPYALAFSPDAELFALENGYDNRGSRPIAGAPDCLWAIQQGSWYGWPDFAGGEPVFNNAKFGRENIERLLAEHPNEPPQPVALLGVHSSSNGLDFSRSDEFGFEGDAFVAQAGGQSIESGKADAAAGFKVARVDMARGTVEDFAVNKQGPGPASRVGGAGLERPIGVRFNPEDQSLYVVDFGVVLMAKGGPKPVQGTGVVWKVTKE